MSKLLIVDDDEQNLYMLQVLLQGYGYDVESATNGAEALEKARCDPPDMIISDILMPVMDGFSLCRKWKRDEHLKTIPFVFYTATYTDPKDEEFALNLGAERFIVKPVEPEAFMKILQEVLEAYHTGHLVAPREPVEEEEVFITEYNKALIRKLEDKMVQLEETNRALKCDIIKRKQAEEEIRKLNIELEQQVKKRTAELESANKELKSFAYVVSHDLKAPLRGIRQLAHWIVQDYADFFEEDGKGMIALLIDRVQWMDSLIDGILQYSKVGCITRNDGQVDLNRLMNNVIEMIAPSEHIQIIIENELPVIIGDQTSIGQVFQNLLSNAIKFMDKSKGEITIRCVDEGAYRTFSVADNGPGIDEKYHEKIFQIFQTLTPRDVRESTGIGLALVKKIIEAYGGKIWIKSTVGKGSEFFFTLPKSMNSRKLL